MRGRDHLGRACRLAVKYNHEPSLKRRLLIRAIVARLDEEAQETFEAMVCALGWKIWRS